MNLLDDQLIHHRLEEIQRSRMGRQNDNGYTTSCIFAEARSVMSEWSESLPGRQSAFSRLGSVGVSRHQQWLP